VVSRAFTGGPCERLADSGWRKSVWAWQAPSRPPSAGSRDADQGQYSAGSSGLIDACPLLTTHRSQLIWFSIPFMHASTGCTKCSIVLLYRRVFLLKGVRSTCNIILAFLVGWYLWAILSAILTCNPVSKFWDPTLPGHCFDFTALWFSNASVNILTDLTLVILPIPLVASLHLPRRQKVAIWALFATGGLYVSSLL
jgi:hypothetical protein